MKAWSAVLLASIASLVVACDDEKPKAPAEAASSSAASAPAESAPSASAPAASEASAASAATAEPPSSVAAQHVLVAYRGAEGAPKSVTRTKAEAKKRAEEVYAKAKEEGKDFSALVATYSDDPGSKDRAGSVGKFTRDKMVKPFSDAAFALAVGAVSEPVETKFGFHVIKRNQ